MRTWGWATMLVAAVALFASRAPSAFGDEPTRALASGNLRESLDEANRIFQRAIEELGRDHDTGAALALEAAARYRAIARDGGIQNRSLELNAGNAWMLGGDLGRAIVSYRRAERVAPSDPSVRQSLAAARAAAGTKDTARAGASISARALAFTLRWRELCSRGTLVGCAAAGYLAAWCGAFASLAGGRRAFRTAGAFSGVVTLVIVGLLWTDAWDSSSARSAVIVQSGVVGLNGPAAGVYEPTYKAPFSPGVECVVIETRGMWTCVRLPDDGRTWVPSSALEFVELALDVRT